MSLKTIATHSGSFHADEALAVFMLLQLPEWCTSRVIRTRDPEEIDAADIVVDVGAICDPSKNRFDHHQRDFTETFDDKHTITRLSSAGLIYKYYGKAVVSAILGWPIEHPSFNLIYTKVYDDLIEGFDAVDNGVSRFDSKLTPLYKDSTSISARVGRLNPEWNQDETTIDMYTQFMKAVAMTGEELTLCVKHAANAWLPAREVVLNAFNGRFAVHESGLIIIFDSFCSWKDHMYTAELDLKLSKDKLPLYVIYPDHGGSWRVQAVAESLGSFASRKALPEKWRGIRDEALSSLSGIQGCVFVHATGFIGGTKTKKGALDLAVLALTC